MSTGIQVRLKFLIIRKVKQVEFYVFPILRRDKAQLLEVKPEVGTTLNDIQFTRLTFCSLLCKSQIAEFPQFGAATTYIESASSGEDT